MPPPRRTRSQPPQKGKGSAKSWSSIVTNPKAPPAAPKYASKDKPKLTAVKAKPNKSKSTKRPEDQSSLKDSFKKHQHQVDFSEDIDMQDAPEYPPMEKPAAPTVTPHKGPVKAKKQQTKTKYPKEPRTPPEPKPASSPALEIGASNMANLFEAHADGGKDGKTPSEDQPAPGVTGDTMMSEASDVSAAAAPVLKDTETETTAAPSTSAISNSNSGSATQEIQVVPTAEELVNEAALAAEKSAPGPPNPTSYKLNMNASISAKWYTATGKTKLESFVPFTKQQLARGVKEAQAKEFLRMIKKGAYFTEDEECDYEDASVADFDLLVPSVFRTWTSGHPFLPTQKDSHPARLYLLRLTLTDLRNCNAWNPVTQTMENPNKVEMLMISCVNYFGPVGLSRMEAKEREKTVKHIKRLEAKAKSYPAVPSSTLNPDGSTKATLEPTDTYKLKRTCAELANNSDRNQSSSLSSIVTGIGSCHLAAPATPFTSLINVEFLKHWPYDTTDPKKAGTFRNALAVQHASILFPKIFAADPTASVPYYDNENNARFSKGKTVSTITGSMSEDSYPNKSILFGCYFENSYFNPSGDPISTTFELNHTVPMKELLEALNDPDNYHHDETDDSHLEFSLSNVQCADIVPVVWLLGSTKETNLVTLADEIMSSPYFKAIPAEEGVKITLKYKFIKADMSDTQKDWQNRVFAVHILTSRKHYSIVLQAAAKTYSPKNTKKVALHQRMSVVVDTASSMCLSRGEEATKLTRTCRDLQRSELAYIDTITVRDKILDHLLPASNNDPTTLNSMLMGFVDTKDPSKAPLIVSVNKDPDNPGIYYFQCKKQNTSVVQDIADKLGLISQAKQGDASKAWFLPAYLKSCESRFTKDDTLGIYTTLEQRLQRDCMSEVVAGRVETSDGTPLEAPPLVCVISNLEALEYRNPEVFRIRANGNRPAGGSATSSKMSAGGLTMQSDPRSTGSVSTIAQDGELSVMNMDDAFSEAASTVAGTDDMSTGGNSAALQPPTETAPVDSTSKLADPNKTKKMPPSKKPPEVIELKDDTSTASENSHSTNATYSTANSKDDPKRAQLKEFQIRRRILKRRNMDSKGDEQTEDSDDDSSTEEQPTSQDDDIWNKPQVKPPKRDADGNQYSRKLTLGLQHNDTFRKEMETRPTKKASTTNPSLQDAALTALRKATSDREVSEFGSAGMNDERRNSILYMAAVQHKGKPQAQANWISSIADMTYEQLLHQCSCLIIAEGEPSPGRDDESGFTDTVPIPYLPYQWFDEITDLEQYFLSTSHWILKTTEVQDHKLVAHFLVWYGNTFLRSELHRRDFYNFVREEMIHKDLRALQWSALLHIKAKSFHPCMAAWQEP